MLSSTLCQEPKQPKLLDQFRQYLRLHHYSRALNFAISRSVSDEKSSRLNPR